MTTERPTPALDEDRASYSDGALPPADLDALFAAVAAETVDRPPTVRDRLRELASPARLSLAAVLGGTLATVFEAGWGMGMSPGLPDVLTLGTAAVLAVVAARHAQRGLHRPSSTTDMPAAGALVLAPLALAAMYVGAPQGLPLWVHLGCFGPGLVLSMVVSGLVLLFHRDERPEAWRLVAAAAAGGLTGFVVQELHCPATDPVHVIAAHTTVGMTTAMLLAAGSALRRPLRAS